MRQYRIKEHKHQNKEWFTIERKFFGMWFMLDNIDANTTGVHDSLTIAKKVLASKIERISRRIVLEVAVDKKVD